MSQYKKIVFSICNTIEEEKIKKSGNSFFFILCQIESMPDFIRLTFKALILFFDMYSLLIYQSHFYNLNLTYRLEILALWKNSKFLFMRDFFYFFDSFVIYDLASKEQL